jgi:hypothetical protein
MSYNNGNKRDSSSSSSHRNSDKYIPRERDDRRGDDRRGDDRRPRDAYYEAFEGVYGGDVARAMYGESKAPITHPSICIPRTFTTIRGEQTKRAVFNTFRDLRIGHIERIDTVHKTDQKGERYCTVYVHLKWNVTSTIARETRQKLLDGNDIKVVYDEPWFWKCTMSNMERPDDRNPRPAHATSRPRIDLGDGVRALSRGDRQRLDETEHEHHDERQLCNMDPREGEGEGEGEGERED